MMLLHGDHGLIMAFMVGLLLCTWGSWQILQPCQLRSKFQEIGTELAPVVISDVAAIPMYLTVPFVALYHMYLYRNDYY